MIGAKALARQLRNLSTDDAIDIIEELEEDELADAVGFVAEHGMEAFCRAMLNTNEFLFVF